MTHESTSSPVSVPEGDAREIAWEIVSEAVGGISHDDLADRITAAILSRGRVRWSSINTAPKDGTLLLLYKPDQRRTGASTFIGYWDGEGWMPVAGAYRVDATDWAACPRPPSLSSPEEG